MLGQCLSENAAIRGPAPADKSHDHHDHADGLLRQYMPKGSDLSVYSRDELDAIALPLKTRPRARGGFESPLVVLYSAHHAATTYD
jgi:IS30 family transposase